jgi:hypothetical protein
MTQAFIQVPPDSTGAKLQMRQYVRGANNVQSQGVYFDGLPSYRLMIPAIVPAANKYHIVLRNNTGSAQTVYLNGLYCVPDGVAAVTGVINQFNARYVTGTPTLTSVTPLARNSADPALANCVFGHTATAGLTDGGIITPFLVSSEEGAAVPTNTSLQLPFMANLLGQANGFDRPWALRPNEGFAVKQIGAGAVGTLSWILDFSVEAD